MTTGTRRNSNALARLRATMERRSPPSPGQGRTHAHSTRTIVCGICGHRRPRAADASQDICAPCLHVERVKAGIDSPRLPPPGDPELRPLRDALRVQPADELADRVLTPDHEAALRRYQLGNGGAGAARALARRWLAALQREAEKLQQRLTFALEQEALALQADNDRTAKRRSVKEDLAPVHQEMAAQARLDARNHLDNARGHLDDVRNELRQARLVEEGMEINQWNKASPAARRPLLFLAKQKGHPEWEDDDALLAKAESIAAEAHARVHRAPTPEERREAERTIERTTGRPVHLVADPPAPSPTVASVWIVVPHRYQSGIDSGGGFVAREGDLRADGTIRLAPPYDGAPIHGKPYKRQDAANRHADKLSGYGPKTKISRLDAAERIAKALQREGYATRIHFDQEHPEEAISVAAERGTRPHEMGAVIVREAGDVSFDGDFSLFTERQRAIRALVDKALDGFEPDPSKNPPPARRMEISAREAAFDIASLADDEARKHPDEPRALLADLAPHNRDPQRPRQVNFRRCGDRATVARVDVFDDGRILISEDTDARDRADVERLVARALDGRRVVPVEVLHAPGRRRG